jgi:malonyl-CoA O-methyltransferase
MPFSGARKYMFEKIQQRRARSDLSIDSSREGALQWVKNHRIPGQGIRVNHKAAVASQEVTGYFIPTLYQLGERDLAKDLAKWEASVQRPDGAFAAPDNVPYTFDTAQVIRGFLAVIHDLPEVEENLRRACNFVCSQITPEGKVNTPSYAMWQCPDGSRFSDYTDLYVLPPLMQAGTLLAEARYIDAAARALSYFKHRPDLVEFKPQFGTLSHIFGYMMEALIEMGETGLARKGLRQAAKLQNESGEIPAYPGVKWVCSTGIAQLAVAWYKLGERKPADKAVNYLIGLQNPTGGFYGSYGPGKMYLPEEEISWAVKFFLDAILLKDGADLIRTTEENLGSLPGRKIVVPNYSV